MFGNFLYFIIVLLIYTTYQPPEEANMGPTETFFLFSLLFLIFYCITMFLFRNLERQIIIEKSQRLSHAFDSLITRQSIMAVTFFAVNIYGLSLPAFLAEIPLFKSIPTLAALIFICMFLLYLSAIWSIAYKCHSRLHDPGVSRKEYILSNISFSIPVLLPWFLLSGISDIIFILPFNMIKNALLTPIGQAIYFLFFLIIAAIAGPLLIQKFWGCTPLDKGIYRMQIEDFCRKAHLEYSDILKWPLFGGRMITAGVMGLVKRFRFILVTPALLRFLDSKELDAVMAHEIGHVKKNHLQFYLFFFVGYMLLTFAGFDLVVYFTIYIEPAYRFLIDAGIDRESLVSALTSIFLIVIFIIYFRYLFGFFMRNFERQADVYVYELMDNALPLISSLKKIAVISGQSPDRPNWHHFSIKERIDYLNKCETDRRWVSRHHKKIQKSIAVYLAGLILSGIAVYNLHFGETGKKLNSYLIETLIIREIKKNPNNPSLFRELGDYYYISLKRYSDAVNIYEKGLWITPDDPEILNNFAWLLATCEDETFRNPKKALILSKKA
ncbi:MAG: M48 family metalloprotease, partial [Deltaproteobacteria bacterium]|nr:M48 family metalloprotease [Deltaproteobacteria bacterium]